MIFLDLLVTFFKIGAFSFGGGYGMLPLMEQEVLSHGWMDGGAFYNFVAVSESTPGPIAVNMATFIGSSQAGILGAACATLGVIAPSIIIILIIVAAIKRFLQYKIVSSALAGVKPVVVGLILVTGVTLAVKNILPAYASASFDGFSLTALIASVIVGGSYVAYKLILKKNPSPILVIIVSAALGMLLF
ncbi:MAG: chromate transporter [Clostridia bacterium]|nr:chromate transporter [Clostridia bacterium]